MNQIKVGDKVRVLKDIPQFYRKYNSMRMFEQTFRVIDIEDGLALLKSTSMFMYTVVLPTKYLIKVDAEAKEAKIKLGDMVRVKNLHEPFCLDAERHLEITNIPPHAVSQKEWKVISVEARRDCAGHIYTLNHDDSFIYNIPEDCVELVQPTEQTEAEKKQNVGSINPPVEVDLTDSYWDAYTADLAKEIVLKIINNANDKRPSPLGAYAVSVAKSVVENLKKREE